MGTKAAENFSTRHRLGGPAAFADWFANDGGQADYVRRLRAVAYAAFINGHNTIVLGAFGCGAFANDPELVADVMNQVFRHEFPGVFERVVMCIINGRGKTAQDQAKWKAFEQVFDGTSGPRSTLDRSRHDERERASKLKSRLAAAARAEKAEETQAYVEG